MWDHQPAARPRPASDAYDCNIQDMRGSYVRVLRCWIHHRPSERIITMRHRALEGIQRRRAEALVNSLAVYCQPVDDGPTVSLWESRGNLPPVLTVCARPWIRNRACSRSRARFWPTTVLDDSRHTARHRYIRPDSGTDRRTHGYDYVSSIVPRSFPGQREAFTVVRDDAQVCCRVRQEACHLFRISSLATR